MVRRFVPFALALALGTSCAGGADNADPELALVDGKADFAEARSIQYGETTTGQVSGHAFSLFRLDVDDRDELDVIVRRTSGDFDPRSAVYDSGANPIAHVPGSFERTEGGNKKSFVMGEYSSSILILVRADRYEGAGDFELSVECTGGACAGEHPLGDFDIVENALCLQRARECSFSRLDDAAVVDGAAAAALMAECLTADAECSPEVCDAQVTGDTSPRELCDGVADALVFYAARSADCRSQLTDCMDTCNEYEEIGEFLEYDAHEYEFWMTGEAICWQNRYGTSCDEFARGHEACGGTEFREVDGTETAGTCFASWRATGGAWYEFEDDNIDCSWVCNAVEEDCSERCETDDPDSWADCCMDCTSDHALLADDEYYICDF